MKADNKLNGIIAVINTPFTENDKIDLNSVRRYVDHSLACGVCGFLVPAMAAEVNKLSKDERRTMASTVVQAVAGRVPVIGGASAADQRDRMEYTQVLMDLGCEGVLVSIPFKAASEYCDQIHEITSLQPGFLMIQDWDFDGYGIPLDTIVKLFNEVDLFRYLKVEVKPAGVKYSDVLKGTGGKLHVGGGWAVTQMIEALDRGVCAFMSTILHDIYNRIYLLHAKGEREKAQQLHNEVLPALSFSHQHIDISIHFNKRLVHRQGLFKTPRVREPILPFDAYHERVSGELIDHALSISQRISRL